MSDDSPDGGDGHATRRAMLRATGASLAGLGVLAGGATGEAAAADGPSYPSAAWFAREQSNYARTREEPTRQANDPAFQERLQEQSALNTAALRQRSVAEPGWNSEGNLCKEYAQPCCGDPYLYPATEPLYAGDPLYESARRERVAFYDSGLDVDSGGARLSGHVWAPAGEPPTGGYPGVVITNGSVQAPETLYWWFAGTLVEHGYVVLTYDPRGQGRSDTTTPDGTQGSNAHPSVFVTNQVDAIDFLRSTPDDPYPHNEGHLDEPAPVRAHNPFHELVDRDRLGIVGHSLGAAGVSVVQGIGAPGSGGPWPGAIDDANPVDVALAWDNLGAAGESVDSYEFVSDDAPATYRVVPRVPAMGQSADYGLTPAPKQQPPDPEAKNAGFASWREAGISTYQFTVRGGTHYEWSRLPDFPATDWDAWGNELADHASLAWLDRWLKRGGEPGHGTATDRLVALAEEPWNERLSFYYRSAYDFAGRGAPGSEGDRRVCDDLGAGCPDAD